MEGSSHQRPPYHDPVLDHKPVHLPAREEGTVASLISLETLCKPFQPNKSLPASLRGDDLIRVPLDLFGG
jgi:hypothetical protein